MSGAWWRVNAPSAALEELRCDECGELHCYWCGMEFVLMAGGRWTAANPSREHIDAFRDERGRVWRGVRIVAAHSACNNHRGIAPWVPFHLHGTKPKGQVSAERIVRDVVKKAKAK